MTVKKLFKVAEEENYGFISHGATGKSQFLEE
jgi:argininosuccinate synthase